LFILFARLSPRVEARAIVSSRPQCWLGVHRSRGTVAKLAALFAFDAFAGGFIVQGLVAYWFHLRYGVETATLCAIFFVANLLSRVRLCQGLSSACPFCSPAR